jgi:hypothetical protein
LFEELPEDIEKLKGILISYAVKQANEFTCDIVGHKGPIQPFPAFSKNE